MKRFNLMPKEAPHVDQDRDAYSDRESDMSLVVAAIPIIIAIGIVYFLNVQTKTEEINSAVSPAQMEKLNTLKNEYNQLLQSTNSQADIGKSIQERNRLKNNLDAIRSVNLVKSVPLDLLVAIGKNISEKLALTAITKKEDTVLLDGIARDNKSLSEFLDILVSQNVFKNVNIKSSAYSDEFGPYKQKFTIEGML